MLSFSYRCLALVLFHQFVASHLHNNTHEKYAVGSLPHVDFKLPHSWAGQIGIPGTENDELFFWLFETEDWTKSDNLIIWLNGGPGCSSLVGLTTENGPLAFYGNSTVPSPNPYSWTKLANVLYIDQPVGAGYSSGSIEALNTSQVTSDFYQWLIAFYTIFPHLISKKTHIIGESWAGIYVPYFTQQILENYDKLPMNLVSIALGDPTFGNFAAMTDVPTTSMMLQHNLTLKVAEDVMSVFEEADSLCGFTKVLSHATYPPKGKIVLPSNPEGNNFNLQKRHAIGLQKRQANGLFNASDCTDPAPPITATQVNETIFGPCYGPCGTGSVAARYLAATIECFSVYNINDRSCQSDTNVEEYLNLPEVRAAIHAPNKTATGCNQTIANTLSVEDPVPPAYLIIPSIIEQGIKVHIYSGDLDLLMDHIGTELVIQNMTWCGGQGFQFPPSNPFIVNGTVAGNWGYERDLSYHLILNAGHMVAHDQPAAAFALIRDFVIGNSGYYTGN